MRALRDCIAIYPGRVDTRLVDGERALPQEGGFLRRVDHERGRRPLQGRPGHAELVTSDAAGPSEAIAELPKLGVVVHDVRAA